MLLSSNLPNNLSNKTFNKLDDVLNCNSKKYSNIETSLLSEVFSLKLIFLINTLIL